MRRYVILLWASFAFFLSACSSKPAPQTTQTVYDTALAILRDFVVQGDRALGFTSADSMKGAYIDTTQGIPIVFAREDSLVQNGLAPSTFTLEHRIVFPVYAGGQIHSAITFDSVFQEHRIQPVSFEDGSDFADYWSLARSKAKSVRPMIVEAPFFQSTFYVSLASGGTSNIVVPTELAKRIGMKISPFGTYNSGDAFVAAAKAYLKSNVRADVRISGKVARKN